MLPSRLFCNTGIAPRFRSLMAPSNPYFSPSLSVQHRLRLNVNPSTSQVQRAYTTTRPVINDGGVSAKVAPSSPQAREPASSSAKSEEEPKLSLTFTCNVENCGKRSTHKFTKRAYTKGIVLVQCPGCKNRHLIADHLGWFKDCTNNGQLRTIEDIIKQKGETVRRGRIDGNGVVEYADEGVVLI